MRLQGAAVFVLLCAAGLASAQGGTGLKIAGKPWGSPLSDFEGLLPVGERSRVAYFVHPGRAYRLLGVQPRELIYGFFDDRLFAVYAGLEGVDDFGTVRRELQEKLGLPRISMQARGALTVYAWKSGDTRFKLKHYEESGVLKLSLYHAELARQANEALQRDLEEEPPEPVFPLSPTRRREAVDLLEWSTR
ncbi:MAG: hypothetical protein WHT06_15760 [Desulfobacterales bacterium]